MLQKTISLFYSSAATYSFGYNDPSFNHIKVIGIYSLALALLALTLFMFRRMLVNKRSRTTSETWGCGYVAPIPKAQYTGMSYARTFAKLFGFIVNEQSVTKKIAKTELFPSLQGFTSTYTDIWEKYIVQPPIRWLNILLNNFNFIQNGKIQSYVVYGLLFIVIIVVVSMLSLLHIKI
jgi:hypothetical protein